MQLSGMAVSAWKEGRETAVEIQSRDGSYKHRFLISGHAGFDKAQCCTGGVLTDQIDPETMEFRKEKGVYVCGELLDVCGDCGGYNLHWAFATGSIAGSCAAGRKP